MITTIYDTLCTIVSNTLNTTIKNTKYLGKSSKGIGKIFISPMKVNIKLTDYRLIIMSILLNHYYGLPLLL